MIIGTPLGFFNYNFWRRRKVKKARRQRQLEGCFGSAQGGLVDPYRIAMQGLTPRWNPRDPRAQLTNIAELIYRQVHP